MTWIRFSLVTLLFCSFSFATWQSIGPEGGPGKATCVSPNDDNLVFVGTDTRPSRIWRSTNGGASWEKRGFCCPDGYSLTRIVIDPSDNLYSAVWGGVAKSTDQGLTWTTTTVNGCVYDLAIHPSNPSIIFGAASITSGSNSNFGFIKSTNGGASFSTSIVLAGTNNAALSIAVDPANPDIIYLGGRANGYSTRLFKSVDGGLNWSEKIVVDTLGSMINSLAVHRTNSNIVYAGKFAAGINGGIFRSTDAGESWSRVSSGNGCYSLATTPVNPDLVFCSAGDTIYRSTNAGLTWNKITIIDAGGYNNFWSLVVSQSNANNVYLSAQYCVFYKSTDMGTTWVQSYSGIRACIISALGIAPSTPATMYSEWPRSGIFKTTDAGSSWSLYSSFPSECGAMCAFAVNYTNPDIIYTMEGDA